MLSVAGFGEIIIRLIPHDRSLFSSLPDNMEFQFSGSELAFLANLSRLGCRTFMVSALPENSIAVSALRKLDKTGIDRKYIIMSKKGRMGINFIEKIACSDKYSIIYDREKSVINSFDFHDFPFHRVFFEAEIFHVSGIAPSLSRRMMVNSIKALQTAKEFGLKTSFALKYQKGLWNYCINGRKVKPGNVIAEILHFTDYAFCNERDIRGYFNVNIPRKSYLNDHDSLSYYENLLLQMSKMFPHIKVIAMPVIYILPLKAVKIGGILYVRHFNQFLFSPCDFYKFAPLTLESIYSLKGVEEAFSSGFIFAYKETNNLQEALDFAVNYSVSKISKKSYITFGILKNIFSSIKNRGITNN